MVTSFLLPYSFHLKSVHNIRFILLIKSDSQLHALQIFNPLTIYGQCLFYIILSLQPKTKQHTEQHTSQFNTNQLNTQYNNTTQYNATAQHNTTARHSTT